MLDTLSDDCPRSNDHSGSSKPYYQRADSLHCILSGHSRGLAGWIASLQYGWVRHRGGLKCVCTPQCNSSERGQGKRLCSCWHDSQQEGRVPRTAAAYTTRRTVIVHCAVSLCCAILADTLKSPPMGERN